MTTLYLFEGLLSPGERLLSMLAGEGCLLGGGGGGRLRPGGGGGGPDLDGGGGGPTEEITRYKTAPTQMMTLLSLL